MHAFASKFKSKREIYTFLTVDGKAYLPPHDNVTIYFLKDLMSGKKKFVSQDRVRHISVPQYDTLSIESK